MAERTVSGVKEPKLRDIAENVDDYEFRINRLIITPEIEVWKNGGVVKIIDNGHVAKLSGTLNPQYGPALLNDIINDFVIGIHEKLAQKKEEDKKIAAQMPEPTEQEPAK